MSDRLSGALQEALESLAQGKSIEQALESLTPEQQHVLALRFGGG